MLFPDTPCDEVNRNVFSLCLNSAVDQRSENVREKESFCCETCDRRSEKNGDGGSDARRQSKWRLHRPRPRDTASRSDWTLDTGQTDSCLTHSIHDQRILKLKTILDRESRSDRLHYCVTVPIRTGHWPMTLTFNYRRAIWSSHTHRFKGQDWKQTDGQTDRPTDGPYQLL